MAVFAAMHWSLYEVEAHRLPTLLPASLRPSP
jgi:hypothetical protein